MGSQFNSKQLRILCLHGYRQNDSMFREKLGGLRKQFKKIAHFEFINAPLIPNVSVTEDRGAGRGWWFSKQENVFSSRDVTNIATGFEESVKTICQYIDKNGPFDGVLGFSQGASMAHLILAMEHLGEIKLGFRFAILCAGFLSLSSVHDKYRSVSIDIPSLHIYGSGDSIVLLSTSEKLQMMFSDNISIVHDGGHYVPSMSKFKEIFHNFLIKYLIRN